MNANTEGDKRVLAHAHACGVGIDSECGVMCRCWCHGVRSHPLLGTRRADVTLEEYRMPLDKYMDKLRGEVARG